MLQRGLVRIVLYYAVLYCAVLYTLYTYGSEPMEYLRCYDSWANQSTKEQLWSLIRQGDQGFISDRLVCLRVWIPDRLVPFALLIDSTLSRQAQEDYIV